MMLNFGMSHTISGLSKRQNLAIVLYANLLLLPTVYKVTKKELVFESGNLVTLSGIYIHIYIYEYIYSYI